MMRQRSHLFEWLKEAEKIKAYMAHGMDYQKKLSAKLEMTKAVEAIAQKVTVESASLLREACMKNDMLQAKIHQSKSIWPPLNCLRPKVRKKVLG